MRDANIDEAALKDRIESHLINYDVFNEDDFDLYFIDRASLR